MGNNVGSGPLPTGTGIQHTVRVDLAMERKLDRKNIVLSFFFYISWLR